MIVNVEMLINWPERLQQVRVNKQGIGTKGQYEKCPHNPCSWIRLYNIVNMVILSKVIYKLNAIAVKY